MQRLSLKLLLFCGFSFLVALASSLENPINLTNSSILSPDEVFKVTAIFTPKQEVMINFAIAPNYYIYKDRLKITTWPQNVLNLTTIKQLHGLFIPVPVANSQASLVMESEEVLTGKFTLTLPVKQSFTASSLILNVIVQGCDGKSICYPPKSYQFNLTKAQENLLNPPHSSQGFVANMINFWQQLYNGGTTSNTLLANLNLIEITLIFFLAGIAIALTPCMYPLYPIALSAIIGQSKPKASFNTFKLAFCYIHGIAFIYILMGLIAAFSGKLLTTMMQLPVVILFSAVVLLILGLAMFDLLDIKLSHKVQSYFNQKSANLTAGKYTSALLLGIASSLLLGPCITPPLIIAIGFIAHKGNLLIGTLGLYAIALGMGIPILILATLGNKLLPKSGYWMLLIKHALGAIIIALSIYLAYPFISLGNSFISIGILCFVVALVFLLIKNFRPLPVELLIHRIIPILFILLGIIITSYGAKSLALNSQTKLNNQQIDGNGFRVVTSKSQLDELINQNQQPIIIDIYANWCTVCKEMELATFSNQILQQKLANYLKIKFDITANLPEYYTVLNHYDLYGPPAIIILNAKHKVIRQMLGFTSSQALLKQIDQQN